MYITRVEFDTLSHDESQGISCGAVKLTTQDGTIVLHCSAQHQADALHRDILHLLLDNAMTQLKRMPEYRTGQRQIELAADAWHDQAGPTSNTA